ncbi:pleckstrin homology domain-containing family O member 2-like isoform X3 [Puntigrus tetrazona]|uniref:pleckstrin homology domain-containing family O member 2-like isoform X3 n=1 Tax=Puntigrus tetrazona TaxID=1606681 RepID=UPI001C899869|nr:pleckstrin homology domain-containing family O member 2-like isoform X3 [Puntigrus tetrazona]
MSKLNMGSEQCQDRDQIICALCEKSDETEVTGPLSSKDNISAHQNCLLYASAIFCTNSPIYDDLFGFDVEDVKKEMKRGKRLVCHYCKRAGATAGCDVKRCKRSYHYPCAIKDRARAAENSNEGSYRLFCELHDPESKKISSENVLEAAPCGPRPFKRRNSVVGDRPNMKRLERRDSSSSGSSEVSLSKKKKTVAFILIDSDDEDESMNIKEESDTEPPVQSNPSTPDPESKRDSVSVSRPSAEPSPSTTGTLCKSPLKVSSPQKASGSSDHPEDLKDKSTPVPKKTRLCEKLKPSPTEADDDTDVDSSQEESQSLLSSKWYRITTPCQVILDSGPSVESEHSLEPSSPASAAVSTSPEQKEAASTSRSSPAPRAPTTEPVSPTIYSVPAVERFSCDSGRPAAAKASKVGTTEKPKSSASVFWTRCNEAGWTKEIFSELESQLSSLGERVQSQKASDQDYDAALKVLEASGRLPCIISQLEQDIEKQEQDLKRKKAALRDAKAVLDV